MFYIKLKFCLIQNHKRERRVGRYLQKSSSPNTHLAQKLFLSSMKLLRALPKQALQGLKDGKPTSSGQPVPELTAHAHDEELSLMKQT